MVLVSFAGCNRGRDFLAPSISVLLAAMLKATAAAAQTVSLPQQVEAAQPPLPAIRVVGRRATQRGPVPKPRPEAAPPTPSDNKQMPTLPLAGIPMTPLNAVLQSATRLGLPVIETPASVEVVEQKTIQDQGYRTTTETAQGAVGVLAGDSAGAPANFSLRTAILRRRNLKMCGSRCACAI